MMGVLHVFLFLPFLSFSTLQMATFRVQFKHQCTRLFQHMFVQLALPPRDTEPTLSIAVLASTRHVTANTAVS